MVAQANKRPVKLYSEIRGFDGYAAARRIGRLEFTPKTRRKSNVNGLGRIGASLCSGAGTRVSP